MLLTLVIPRLYDALRPGDAAGAREELENELEILRRGMGAVLAPDRGE